MSGGQAPEWARLCNWGAPWPCLLVVLGWCGALWHGVCRQLCSRAGEGVWGAALMWELCEAASHMPPRLQKWSFTPVGNSEPWVWKKSVQGKENVLFAHLPLFLVFSPSVNQCRQVSLTVLCWETTLLSHLVQALVEICWLWRMKLKLLLPHPVSLFHLAMMPSCCCYVSDWVALWAVCVMEKSRVII